MEGTEVLQTSSRLDASPPEAMKVDLYTKCEKEEEGQDFACNLTFGLSFRALGAIKNWEVRGGEFKRDVNVLS